MIVNNGMCLGAVKKITERLLLIEFATFRTYFYIRDLSFLLTHILYKHVRK